MRKIMTIAVLLTACDGTFDGGTPLDPTDAGPGGGDGAPVVSSLAITGTVHDFFDTSPLPSVLLATDGLTPALSSTSDGAGGYMIADLPDGAVFSVLAAATNYRATRNPLLTMANEVPGTPALFDIYVVSTIGAQRQASTLGLPTEPDTAVVFAELVNGQGLPKEGVPLDQITLTDGAGAPAGIGPYFVGTLGDVDDTILTSTAFNGHARVAFLNVPPGTYTLSALFQVADGGGGGTGTPVAQPVTTLANGAELLILRGGGGSGGGM
jgi:hypothetical protein